MKVIVCGGRDFKRREWLFHCLDFVHDNEVITVVIEGGARGADRFAREWAIERQIPYVTVEADWVRFKLYGGPERNQRMLDMKPDLVLAFPGGKGTADMVKRAKLAGVKVIEYA